MTTVAQSLIVISDSTARLRAWGSAMNANLITCGLVQASDTGQINWITINANPGGTSTNLGYEMYKLGDSLQTTKPVFIKIEYTCGSSFNTSNQPGFYITIGTSTDGAGTINSAVQTVRYQLGSYSAVSTPAVPCIWAGDGSYFMFMLGYTNGGSGSNTTPYAFMIFDRTRDSSGAVTGEGFWAIRSSWSTAGYSVNAFSAGYANMSNGSTANPSTSWNEVYGIFDRGVLQSRNNYSVAMIPGNEWGSGADGTDITCYPLLIQGSKQTYVHAMLVGFNADFTQASPITTTVLGTTHTYLPIKYTPTGHSNHCMLLRWE